MLEEENRWTAFMKKVAELRTGNIRGGLGALLTVKQSVMWWNSGAERRCVIPRWHISQCRSYVKVTQSQSARFRKEGVLFGWPL